jgi:ferritin-like metal-binding protein YciE
MIEQYLQRYDAEIRGALLPSESYGDFSTMVHIIVQERLRAAHRIRPTEHDVKVALSGICAISYPGKPPKYREDVRQLRMRFHGIRRDENLRESFRSILREQLLRAENAEQLDVSEVNAVFWSEESEGEDTGEQELSSLRSLYIEELQTLYDAEWQVVERLPTIAAGASDPDLRAVLDEHEHTTREQLRRIEDILTSLGWKLGRIHSKGMQGLLDEGEAWVQSRRSSGGVLDAGLIVAAQRIQHYELAGYRAVHVFARRLGLEHQADVLERSLTERAEAEERLTRIAEGIIAESA